MNTRLYNKMVNKILDLYKLCYSNDINSEDYYFHWLENDLGRWLNNDHATGRTIDDKLIQFLERVPDISLNQFLEGHPSSNIISNKILNTMTCAELTEFLRFIYRNIFNTNNVL